MKHLKKYNEAKLEGLDHDYIKECFVDFINDDMVETEFDRPDLNQYEAGHIPVYGTDGIEIFVSSYVLFFPEFPEVEDRNNLEQYMVYCKELNEFLLKIEYSFEKVRIKYPNINFVFNNEEGAEELIFWI